MIREKISQIHQELQIRIISHCLFCLITNILIIRGQVASNNGLIELNFMILLTKNSNKNRKSLVQQLLYTINQYLREAYFIQLNLNNKKQTIQIQIIINHKPYQSLTTTQSMSTSTTDQSSQLLREQIQNEQSKKKKGFSSQQLGDRIMLYVKSAFWLGLAIFTVYYSNFFHHLFWNPKINQIFFQIAMAGYTMITMLILYSSIVLPYIYKIKSIEEYNPKLIPVGAVVGVISVISLIIAIWPVWGFTSLLIFVALWKGFFSLPMFLPSGPVGDGLFLLINVGTVLSFYVIEHEGFLH